MPKKAFTDRWIKSLKTNSAQVEYTDDAFKGRGALVLIVSGSGKKTFYHRYMVERRRKRDLLGTYPSLSLTKARETAISNVTKLTEGIDPAEVKRIYRTAETFGELAELYFERNEGKLSPWTIKNYRNMYNCDLKERWHNRKARNIKKSDIIDVLEHICYERKAPFKCNRTHELIRRIFNFAISRDVLEYNPVQGLEKLGREQPGERLFSKDEIRIFWQATENQLAHVRCLFRLLLLTGQRPGEIKGIKWDHLDGDILTIPSENSKNRRRHRIHLTETALQEIEAMEELSGSREYVFSLDDRDVPLKEHTKAHWAMMEAMELLDGGDPYQGVKVNPKAKTKPRPKPDRISSWTVRDIRRTVQTRMAEAGIRPDVIDRVLNHNVAGVRRHYDHYSYFPEIRSALIRWERELLKIVYGKREEKVITLGSGSRRKAKSA
jgi:integrase